MSKTTQHSDQTLSKVQTEATATRQVAAWVFRYAPVVAGLWGGLSLPALAQNAQANPPLNAQPAENSQGAQTSQTPLKLKLDSSVLGGEAIPDEQATYISADRLKGDGSNETLLEGNVEIRRGVMTLRSDTVTYSPLTDRAVAEGNLVIEQPDLLLKGPRGSVKMGSRAGSIEYPTYELKQLKGKGSASRMEFDGVDTLTLENPNYTVCPIPDPARAKDADWYVEAEQLELDQAAETGTARNAKVVFKDVPILATPYLSFPTSDRRKSGFLPPSIGSSSRSGTEFTLPYYWNIAPNRDLTLYPKLMTSRGLQLGSSARYLGDLNRGTLKFDYLPDDRKTLDSRYAVSFAHLYAKNELSAGINYNDVSDDQYFVDFSRTQSVASQRILLQEAYLRYQKTDWELNTRAVVHQTLQLEGDELVEPYDKLPEINLTAYPKAFGKGYLSAAGQLTDFASDTRPEGQRAFAQVKYELPYVAPAWELRGAASVRSTNYQLDQDSAIVSRNPSTTVPTFSLDGTLYFDRSTTLLGHQVNQTLEPRLFYLYTPNRDQDDQPLFDTTLTGEGFSRIFSDNRYAGQDRIGDANQVTIGAVSRFTTQDSGIEFARLEFGQRLYFTKPKVRIPGEPLVNGSSDYFFGGSARLSSELSASFLGQFDGEGGRNERSNFNVSYKPGPGKQFNAGYRYTRDDIDQFDLSGQWPLARKWSGVGRLNYSVLESRSIESLLGLEYNDGCWVARFVGQRFAVAPSLSTTSLFFQLELTGLGRLGSDPVELLSRKIPGYQPLTSGALNQ